MAAGAFSVVITFIVSLSAAACLRLLGEIREGGFSDAILHVRQMAHMKFE